MNKHSERANYRRIEIAIAYLEANFQDQPSLEATAASAGLSKFHFQRLFKNFAGITPTQFLHYLTVEYAKGRLAESRSVFDSALDSGLSGGGRLHDMFINIVAMTPGEYKELGKGVVIYYGVHSTPFGEALIALTRRGICALRFLSDNENVGNLIESVKAEWPNADFRNDPSVTEKAIREIFDRKPGPNKLTLLVRGTNFQIRVWQALLNIPEGALVSYQDVAAGIKEPTSTRAVASAIARNPIAYLIPCHRVISKQGKTHQYRWGQIRKKTMIGYEAAKAAQKG